ncbi:MAG: ATP12 family protein [Pseudomonadota bacterium]|nr:ATP12 family protein [Pseudomonadota bacterium]
MKKNFKDVGIRECDDGFLICLDQRPVKTPAQKKLSIPNAALAKAVAEEWRSYNPEVDPIAMPLTRLANSAVDRISGHRDSVIDEISGFAATDLVCYRSEEPSALCDQQNVEWGGMLLWLRQTLGIDLKITDSVLPLDQNQEDLDAVRRVVSELDDYSLSGLHMVTTACGSVVLGLAVAFGKIEGAEAWELSLLEETFQKNKWGEDSEDNKRREDLRIEIGAAARFLALLREYPISRITSG